MSALPSPFVSRRAMMHGLPRLHVDVTVRRHGDETQRAEVVGDHRGAEARVAA